jgi:hypothetical protein
MTGQLDRHVAPVGIDDVERVVVDEDQEDPDRCAVAGQILLGDPVLALARGGLSSRWRRSVFASCVDERHHRH